MTDWNSAFTQNPQFQAQANTKGNFTNQEFPSLGGDNQFAQQQQQQQNFNQFQGQGQFQAQPQFYQQQQFQGQPQQFQQQQFQPFQQPTTLGTTVTSNQNSNNSTTTSDASKNTSFNTKATEFVPKGKMVKTVEQFPTLGEATTKQPPKKATTVQPVVQKPVQQVQPDLKSGPPCFGKPKEFFMMQPLYPNMMPDPITNPFLPNEELQNFMYINYPLHALQPQQMIAWLYTQAALQEEMEALQKQALAGDNVYGKKPQHHGGKRVKGKNTKDDESSEEETEFLDYKNMKKKEENKNKQKAQEKDEKKISKPKVQKKPKENKKEKNVDDKKIVPLQNETLVEVDETRQPASLVFIGHVDAGKSTISGNLMFMMGVVDQRTIQKYKEEAKEKNRESWWLAYAMDINEEEKAKGKTVEVGRASFDINTKRITIFDAPGHKNYVPNMIQGAALADYGALVISAKKGEFEAGFEMEGQTREHIQLAKSLGISKLIVIVNKMDEASVKWSKERFTEIKTAVSPFIEKSGFSLETDVEWVPVSGISGDNLKEPVKSTTCGWYTGKTFMQILDDIALPKRDPKGPLRIPILDKMKDRGVVIFGKVEQGTVTIGDKVQVSPSNISCQVHSIYNSKEEPVRYATPGENIKIRLLGVTDDNLINKGDVLCPRESPVPVSDLIEVEIDVLELLKYKPIMSKGYQCILHIHTVADEAVIKDILVSYEKNEKGEIHEKQKPMCVMSYQKMICRIQTRLPIPLEKHDVLEQMGRFTLRDEGKTIALGKVIKYKPYKQEASAQAQTQVEGQSKQDQEENKKQQNQQEEGTFQIDTQTNTDTSAGKKKEDLIFDSETGEMLTSEEYHKRQESKQMEEINEEDYGEEDDESSEEENESNDSPGTTEEQKKSGASGLVGLKKVA